MENSGKKEFMAESKESGVTVRSGRWYCLLQSITIGQQILLYTSLISVVKVRSI